MDTINESNLEVLKYLYTELSQNLRFFVEWRFKSITRYILTVSAMLGIFGWINWERNFEEWNDLSFFPFILISLASFLFYRLEIRNAKIQNMIVNYGLNIEKKMSEYEGIYSGLNKLFIAQSYSFMLKFAYIIMGILSFIISVILIILFL